MVGNEQILGRIGSGSAQVLSNAPILQAYQNGLLMQQKRRQAEDDALASELNKIDVNGVKDADREDVLRGYDSVADTYAKFKTAKTPEERIKAQLEFNNAKKGLSGFIDQSKQYNQDEAKGIASLQSMHPDIRPDEGFDILAKRRELKSSDSTYKDYLNPELIASQYKSADLGKLVKDNAKYRSVDFKTATPYRVGDKSFVDHGEAVDPLTTVLSLSNAGRTDPSARRAFKQKYTNNYLDVIHNNPKAITDLEQVVHQLNPNDPKLAEFQIQDLSDYAAANELLLNFDDLNAGKLKQTAVDRGKPPVTNVYMGSQPNAYGQPVGSGGKDIYLTAIGTDGKPIRSTVSLAESYTFPNVKGSISSAPNIISADNGQRLSKAGNIEFSGGEVVLAPVYKKGLKSSQAGKDLSDLMVPNDVLETEKKKGNVVYETLFTFTDNTGKKTFYTPAKDVLANVQLLKSGKDDAGQIASMIKELEQKKSDRNNELPKLKKVKSVTKTALKSSGSTPSMFR